MADFLIKVDGVPVPVRGVKDEAEARRAVAEAIKIDPKLLDRQRQRFVETGGTAGNRVLIGAGREFSEARNRIEQGVSALMGDEERALRAHRRNRNERKIFRELDERAIAGEDFGQAVANPLNLLGGAAAARLAASLATKVAGLAGRRAGVLADLLRGRNDVSVKQALEQLSSEPGRRVASELAKVAEKNPKVADEALSAIAKAQQQRVREAQIGIRQQLRQQDSAQNAALAEQQAQREFARIEQQAVRKTERDAFREALRMANTGVQ